MSETPNNNEAVEAQPVASNKVASRKSKRGRRLMIIIIVLLLLGLTGISAMLLSFVAPRSGVASAEDTNGIEWVRSIYGWGSTAEEQLAVPQELSFDDSGAIWVTDTRFPDRALVFSPQGKLLKTVGDKSTERVVAAGAVALSDEKFFLGESAMDRIRVYDGADTDLGFVAVPNPIDMDWRDDKLVVGSTSGFAIINAEDGQPIKIIGERGKGDDQFDTVNGVAFGDDGKMYVVDTYNNRLSAYDADGERLWMVRTGAPGNKIDISGGGAMAASSDTTAPARLQIPADVTVDGRGRLVVVDSMDFSVSVFDPKDGTFIAKYGEYGAADGQFIYPSSIDYDPARDWFAIADAGNSRIQIVRIPDSGATFDPVASVRRSLTGPLRACLVPLILLLILVIAFVWRSRRNRVAKNRMNESDESVNLGTSVANDES